MAQKITWIDEKEAAKMLGRTPEVMRKKIKAAVWPITYTSIHQRAYKYSLQDIEAFLLANSNKTKAA